jgi:hypothetical protein
MSTKTASGSNSAQRRRPALLSVAEPTTSYLTGVVEQFREVLRGQEARLR